MNKSKNSTSHLYETDFEHKSRTSGELSNVITSYMIDHELTLEILELACEKVKHVYKTDAVIRKY